MNKVPDNIVAAINGLLAPYGETYSPGQPEVSERRGYVNWKGAVEYTSLSKSTLQRAIYDGRLKRPHRVAGKKTGTALFALADLDAFIRAR